MSTPAVEPAAPEAPPVPDVPMEGSGAEEEGEGDATMADAASDDSSEEPDEDAEEERRIRDGFIVDEDEEEEEEEDDAERRRRRKRRKRRHRREEEDEDLEEEDLELLEENTGTSFAKKRLTRLRRGRDSDSPGPRPKRKTVAESSDEDLDGDDLELPQVQDIQRIWDDGGAGRDDEDEADMDDMDNFIEYEEEDEGAGALDEQERAERRKAQRRERRKAMLGNRELAGIDANAWDEIHEVFGDGHEYDWALGGEEEAPADDEQGKGEMRYQDVFEPSEIKARMLTEDDDLMRAQDTPERMQLATSSLSQSSTLSMHRPLTENDLDDAAAWVLTRLSARKEREYFRPDGQHFNLLGDLVQAITYALRFLFIHEFEVPYIWTHKRDYISYFNPRDMRSRVELLSLEELWRVYALGQKYRSLQDRRAAMDTIYDRLGVSDDYFEGQLRKKAESVEVVADATEWLSMKYKAKKKDNFELHFHDDDDQQAETQKRKLPSRTSAYEVAKKSIVSKLAEGFGLTPQEVVLNFMAKDGGEPPHLIADNDLNPDAFADQFTDPALPNSDVSDVLSRARLILGTELGKDPLLRQEMRNAFKTGAHISVLPTERGIAKIDEHHHYFNFKYLHQKKVTDMLETAQFLHILAAEAEHLVVVEVALSTEAKAAFERKLIAAFASEGFGENVRLWNEQRALVINEVIEQHLLPAGIKWTREWLREEVEDFLSGQCAESLRARIDVAPYATPDMQAGDTPSVLAVSWGKGNPQKDDITLVFLDDAGRLREHTRIDNLFNQECKDEFRDFLQRRKPDVVVVGGFSMATADLSTKVKQLINPSTQLPEAEHITNTADDLNIPVIYVFDDVARMYQNSKRAEDEFSALTSLAKYCVGLCRYTQSPVNEYAALGVDITTISFDEDNQQLIPREKLLAALERTLVDVINNVGVDINRAVIDSYYQHLLPFVCGLGPRKAEALAKKIGTIGGSLINRDQFIKNGLLTTKIFLNAAGFLRITAETYAKPSKHRHNDDADVADPLDSTRIHPEDYELARKMATDALELDEEDIQDEHPSHVVSMIMQDEDNVKKLDELNLDDFAVNMFEANEDRKRHTLNLIRDELLKPFGDRRHAFPLPDAGEVLTMLSGETSRTLRVGLIISVLVQRFIKDQNIVAVRLDSGVEGMIQPQYLADHQTVRMDQAVNRGQAIPGVIIQVKMDLPSNQFLVELSSRPADVAVGDGHFRRVKHDEAWNHIRHQRDTEMQARKKRAEVGQARRIIKHPNFHNFTASEAERFLDKQQRGDVVVRPSSKGIDHLAVTWKVDEKLFQHIDVVEPGADPTGQTAGSRFIVDGRHEFTDLDELIVNHVQAMARRVEELMAHEKYKHGEDELHLHLRQYVAANPSKSAYGFTLNRKRPGHFNLCFLANKSSTIQTWPVRVAPEAYYLYETPAAGVPELCDAFKVRHLHESQNLGGGAGGKTPYAGRTPGRTPGHATPGHASVRQVGRTPNPYSAPAAPTPTWGAPPPPAVPAYGAVPPPHTPYGYQTPVYPQPAGYVQPPLVPPGMNPERAKLLQQSIPQTGGWPQGSGGW